MEVACKHVIDLMGIKQQAERFGLGAYLKSSCLDWRRSTEKLKIMQLLQRLSWKWNYPFLMEARQAS